MGSKAFKKRDYKLASKVSDKQAKMEEDKKAKERREKMERKESEEGAREMEKIREQEIWYEFLIYIIRREFTNDPNVALSVEESKRLITKIRLIKIEEAEILHEKLKKHYDSMKVMWRTMAKLEESDTVSFIFLIRYYILEMKGQATLESVIQQDRSRNVYPLNFYDYQTGLTKLRNLMLKLADKSIMFWGEVSSYKPDEKKLLGLIEEINVLFRKITRRYKVYCEEGQNSVGNSEYERQWKKKVKVLVDSIYIPFMNAFGNLKKKVDDKEMELLQEEPDAKKPKNLIFYDAHSRTGMCKINIQDGAKFASIMGANKQFWNLMNTPRMDGATPETFLPKEMSEQHRRMMVEFLNTNRYYLDFHPGFILDCTNKLIEIEFSGQMLPNLYEGLQMAVFLRSCKNYKPIMLLNTNSDIISFNESFDIKMRGKNIDELDEIINRDLMAVLNLQGRCEVQLGEEVISLKVYHKILNELEPSKSLMYVEIECSEEDFSQFTQNENSIINPPSFLEAQLKEESKKKEPPARKENDEVPFIMSIIKNENKCKNISLWFRVEVALLLVIGALLLSATALTSVKEKLYLSYLSECDHLNNLISNIILAESNLRKANIDAYRGQSDALE